MTKTKLIHLFTDDITLNSIFSNNNGKLLESLYGKKGTDMTCAI